MKKRVGIAVLALLAIYSAVALSPMRSHLGRTHPAISAALSGPTFNFHHEYTDGQAMGLVLGTSRDEVRRQLLAQSAAIYLQSNCSGIKSPALIAVGDTPLFREATGSDGVCVHFHDRRLMLILEFTEDRLSEVGVHVITNELI